MRSMQVFTAVQPRTDTLTVHVNCDLAQVSAFCEAYSRPHAPVLSAFGAGPLHTCRWTGAWDLQLAVAENADALVRSIHNLQGAPNEWDDLTFQFRPRTFLYADMERIVGFASTPTEAEQIVDWFKTRYGKPPQPSGGSFHLIRQGPSEISLEIVPLPADTILDPDTFRLHYGTETAQWQEGFLENLRTRNHGISIFEGIPGTGKTSYLRHLMGLLKDSHRFYFIPTAMTGVLSKPEFIGFWANQRRKHCDQKFVVILEDSDTALMTRGADNREKVSAILNLSDGMLGDFLRLQIICTINCKSAEIDQALLRPGRLVAHRVFERLSYAQATRLAEQLGKALPTVRDYTLAEVFAGDGAVETGRKTIGFAA